MIVEMLAAIALQQDGLLDRRSSTFLNGNELLEFCRDLEGGQPSLHCASYLLGLVDYESDLQMLGKAPHFCIPVGVTARQMRDVVVRQLESDSAQRHLSAASHVVIALADTFPCA